MRHLRAFNWPSRSTASNPVVATVTDGDLRFQSAIQAGCRAYPRGIRSHRAGSPGPHGTHHVRALLTPQTNRVLAEIAVSPEATPATCEIEEPAEPKIEFMRKRAPYVASTSNRACSTLFAKCRRLQIRIPIMHAVVHLARYRRLYDSDTGSQTFPDSLPIT